MVLLPAFGFMPAIGGYEFTLAHWRDLFGVPGIVRSILLSLLAGIVTPAIALAVVFLFMASASATGLDRWVRRFVSPLLAIPHAAAAFGLVFMIAPAGLLARLISPDLTGWDRPADLLIVNDSYGLAMIAGLVIKEIPFLLLVAITVLPQLNPAQRVSMARSLGYGPSVAWLKMVAPGLYPLMRLPLVAVIAFASANVDVALILGPTLPPTLSVRLLGWFGDPDLSMRFMAAAAALLQLGVSLLAVVSWLLGEKMVSKFYRLWVRSGNRLGGDSAIFFLGRTLLPAALVVIGGSMLALFLSSFSLSWRFPHALPASWTVQHWVDAIPGMGTPVFNTLIIAAVSTTIALVLVVGSLEFEQRSDRKQSSAMWLLYLPLLMPQVVFLFGMVVFAEFFYWQPNLWLVIFGHLLFVVPYVFLVLSEAYRRLDPHWSQLAAALGASPSKTFWRIRIPLLLAPALSAMAMGIAISASIFLPTQLLGAGRIATVTTEAIALASGGSRSTIATWALLQSLLPMLGFLVALFVPKILWRNRIGMQEG